MNRRQRLRQIVNSQTNVRLADVVDLLEAFGFERRRGRGSHQVFVHATTGALLSIQERGGGATPYQVRQFLKLVERYNLTLGDPG